MKLEKCSAIRLETLNHAIVTNPNGVIHGAYDLRSDGDAIGS